MPPYPSFPLLLLLGFVLYHAIIIEFIGHFTVAQTLTAAHFPQSENSYGTNFPRNPPWETRRPWSPARIGWDQMSIVSRGDTHWNEEAIVGERLPDRPTKPARRRTHRLIYRTRTHTDAHRDNSASQAVGRSPCGCLPFERRAKVENLGSRARSVTRLKGLEGSKDRRIKGSIDFFSVYLLWWKCVRRRVRPAVD